MADDMDFGQPVEEGDEVAVTIEDMGSKGDGIARIEGFVIFVPETEIGETVKIEVETVGSKFAFGKVIERNVSEEGEGYDKEEVEEEETDYEKEEVEEQESEGYDKEEVEEQDGDYEKEEVEEEQESKKDYDKEEVEEHETREPQEDPYYQ